MARAALANQYIALDQRCSWSAGGWVIWVEKSEMALPFSILFSGVISKVNLVIFLHHSIGKGWNSRFSRRKHLISCIIANFRAEMCAKNERFFHFWDRGNGGTPFRGTFMGLRWAPRNSNYNKIFVRLGLNFHLLIGLFSCALLRRRYNQILIIVWYCLVRTKLTQKTFLNLGVGVIFLRAHFPKKLLIWNFWKRSNILGDGYISLNNPDIKE